MTQFRKRLADLLRPHLVPPKWSIPGLLTGFDELLDQAGVPRDGADMPGGLADLVPPAVVPASAPAPGNNRYLPVFQRLASPQASPAVVQAMARSFAEHAPEYGQDKTKPRIAEFVAQIAHETGGFTRFEENLHYSARRLMEVWPGRFPTLASAQPYGWDPSDPDREDVALANMIYGKRFGNELNGTDDDDGWKYRGRGPLQLTFQGNYELYGRLTGLDLVNNPDMAADPYYGVIIAMAFFKQVGVNTAIDAGDFTRARLLTNGSVTTPAAKQAVADVARLRAKALAVL